MDGLIKLRDPRRASPREESECGITGSSLHAPLAPIPLPRSFYKESKSFLEINVRFRNLSSEILHVFHMPRHESTTNLTRDQWEGFKEIRDLIKRNEFRLSFNDKGGGFMICSQALEQEITELHFADSSVYRGTSEKAFHSLKHVRHDRLNQ